MNNEGIGAAKPKVGDNAVVLNRGAQFNQAMSALASKTKSQHPATSMNNQWIGLPGSGTGGNVCGYSKNGGCSH